MSAPTTRASRSLNQEGSEPPNTTVPRASILRKLQDVVLHPLFAVVFALLALLVAFSALNGTTFASVHNFQSIGVSAAVTIVLAVGITYVLISEGFDLSVGSVLVFSGVVSVKAMEAVGGSGWGTALIGLGVALAAGAAWGMANGAVVALAGLNPIIVTLGSLGAALGLAQVIAGGQDLVDVPAPLVDFGNGRTLEVPNVVFVALALALVAGVVLAKTVYGRFNYAVGSSKVAAERAGLPVRRQLWSVYVFSGTCAGLAGWLSLALFSTTNLAGHSLDNLTAAEAAILGGVSLYGGVGTIAGAVVGAFIPSVLVNGLVITGVQSYWQQVIIGVVLVLAVYIDRERRKHSD